MEKKRIFSFSAFPYRQKITVDGFYFGDFGEKTVAVMGSTRRDEYQQMLTASLLVKRLKTLEAEGAIPAGIGILVIPTASQFSMNVGKRFFPVDNTDINRMFPGYDKGETTQRLADGLFKALRDYKYGIHLASFYLHGNFVSHVRAMNTGYQDNSLAADFGFPYCIIRKPQPIDTTTLNYNWQVFETTAFSVYSGYTNMVDMEAAAGTLDAILHFMVKRGCLRQVGGLPEEPAEKTVILPDSALTKIITNDAGLFFPQVELGEKVKAGQVIGKILDPFTAEEVDQIKASCDGTVFFICTDIAISQHTAAFGIIGNS